MKINWRILLTTSKVLTIIFAIMLAVILWSDISYNDPLFDVLYNLMWASLGGTLLFVILWIISKTKVENIIMEEYRIKMEEQRKIEQEKKKQQYEEISDIWEHGEKPMFAVSPSQSEETRGTIYYVKLKYRNSNSTPWVITIYTSAGFSEDFKAKRKGNTLVGLNGNKIAIMEKGQLTIDNEIFYFSTENEFVKTVSGLMKELLNGKKVETVRLEHLEAASEDVIDALPKFHFSFTKVGLKCDEINYPQKHLDDFFEKNNGGEYIFQNKVFYTDYCKNNGLYDFNVFQEREFQGYMRQMNMQAIKSGYSCNTDFQLSEWQVSIRHGIEKLFQIFKSYVNKKTLDVVPVAFDGNGIYYQHKHYFPKNNETMLFYNLAIASMEKERFDNPPCYFIGKTDDGRILINIDGESFVSVK